MHFRGKRSGGVVDRLHLLSYATVLNTCQTQRTYAVVSHTEVSVGGALVKQQWALPPAHGWVGVTMVTN